MSRLARSFMLLVLVGVSFVAYATANTITSFTFKFQPNQFAMNNGVNTATDFTLSTGGTKILQPPNSVPFNMNDWVAPPRAQPPVNFTMGVVPAGQTATFVITTKFPNPGACGYFTAKVMNVDQRVSNQVCGNAVKIAEAPNPPPPPMNDGPFVLENTTGGTLTGNLSVYVDNGESSDFNQTSFETLDSPNLIYSTSTLNLANGQEFYLPTFGLGPNQYLLIEGTLAGNGLDPEPFAMAITPIPEPPMLPLLGAAMAWLAAAKLRKRSLGLPPNSALA